jgi:hypothetical protein
MRRIPHAPAGARPSGATRNAGLAPALKLQRTIGNKAVGQVLAKPAARGASRNSGLRRAESIERVARKAVIFFNNNPDARLHHFAIFLGAALNTELDLLGIPNVKVQISSVGAGTAAAVFDAENWAMILNPDSFTHRGVETLGELTEDEAAIVAMTVYHEARHAEQRFRVARLQAAEGKEPGFAMPDEPAAAAAAWPLEGASALELREAKAWRTNTVGEDATYREAVTSWQGEIRNAARVTREVGADHDDVRERIGRLLKAWSKYGGAEEYIGSHMASARKRGDKVIMGDVKKITSAFDRAEAAYKKLDASSPPADFKPLAEALADLYRAVHAAYRNQPVEHDAWEAGYALFDAFHAQLKRAKKKAAAAAS